MMISGSVRQSRAGSPVDWSGWIGRRGWAWLRSDDGARGAFWVLVVGASVVLLLVGRHQWFIRDDWALILTRARDHHEFGVGRWLFSAQDGHWLTVPILLFRSVEGLFGLSSYWPFLMLAMGSHIAVVVAARVVCRRAGGSAWTTTIVCGVLLVFGSGWENIVFAVQVSYNLSILAFLLQVLLTDHAGSIDWRDGCALVCGVVGLLSSGFGPIFIVGIALFLLLRGRLRGALFAVLPLGVAYVGWWATFGSDNAAAHAPGGRSQVPGFALHGLVATLAGLTSVASLAGVALLAVVSVTIGHRRSMGGPIVVAFAATAAVMFLAIGVERVGFGVETAGASRYVYMGAILLAPAFVLAIDRLDSVNSSMRMGASLLLAASIAVNAGILLAAAADWAGRSRCEQSVLSLLAGDPQTATKDPQFQPVPFSPDVRLRDLPLLVKEGAIRDVPAVTAHDLSLINSALTAGTPTCLPLRQEPFDKPKS